MSMKHENGHNFVNLSPIIVREASELLYTTFLTVHMLFSPGCTKFGVDMVNFVKNGEIKFFSETSDIHDSKLQRNFKRCGTQG